MWQRLLEFIEAIGADPTDSEEIRIQKRMLVAVTGLVAVFAGVWGLVYWSLGEPVAALIPGGYSLLTVLNLLVFARTKRYQLFLHSQLVFYLV
ncbi:MAG: hypothetical protein ACR2NL_09585, partial [Acidimicrobiia bacterium]